MKGGLAVLERARTEPSCNGCSGCSWVFSELSAKEFEALKRLMRPLKFNKGDLIFQEGEPGFGLYIICRGKVKLSKHAPNGKEQILKILGPGEILGEGTLFDREEYSASAKALEDAQAQFIERRDFLDFLEKHHGVALKLIEKLARELRGFESKLIEMAYAGAHERLARLLLAIANKYGIEEAEGRYIGLELSRLELAELASLSLETTIRALGEFRDRGFVVFRGHQIIITDEASLGQLARPIPVMWKENLL